MIETREVSAAAPTPIVVAVNATRRCGETLDVAAALATSTGAELRIVRVEDANLLRLADLPMAREVDRISGATRAIDSGRLQRALDSEARLLHRELARIGRTTRVRSSVEIVRGRILVEALAASESVEVTFVHGMQRSDTVTAAPARPRTRAARTRGRPVWIWFDGTPASERALAVAARIAARTGCDVSALLPQASAEIVDGLRRRARAVAGQIGLRFVEGAGPGCLGPGQRLGPGIGSLLVLAKQCPQIESEATRAALEDLAIPLVLVA